MLTLIPSATGLIPRLDLLDDRSPAGLEVFQITSDPDVPACHISMEARVFTPDSKYFLLHRGVGVQSFDHKTPGHQFLVCDAETGELAPVTDEAGVTAPSVSPDGKCFYYFVDESTIGRGGVKLRRRNMDGSDAVTLAVLDARLPGTQFRPSMPNPLSTISSDGMRLAVSFFLGDGRNSGAPYGLVVFDLQTGEHHLAVLGTSFRNIHAQYCRSSDPELARDILIQENHGGFSTPDGRRVGAGGNSRGADIHVIRDDGQHLRNLPWGRVENEWCSGHQCWRGTTPWVVGSLVSGTVEDLSRKRSRLHVMESLPVAHWGHRGADTPNGIRNRICRGVPDPHFNHIATNQAGDRLIADYRVSWDPGVDMRDAIYLMELGRPGEDGARVIHYLMSSGSSWRQSAHVHPCFSPDGRTALFNSDESGQTQAYLIRNLPGSGEA